MADLVCVATVFKLSDIRVNHPQISIGISQAFRFIAE